MAVLRSDHLSIGYRGVPLCPPISLTLNEGELTCLLGQNGAGKSTLLAVLCGFLPPISGEIYLMDRPLSRYSPQTLSRLLGGVFSGAAAMEGFTVYDVVSLGRHPHTGFFGRLSKDDRQKIRAAIRSVDMEALASRQLLSLSDGERQKTMIARALAQETPLMLLDEPAAFLDLPARMEMMALLRDFAHTRGKSILLSTHDLDSALETADKFWLMGKGMPVTEGIPEDLVQAGAFGTYFVRKGWVFDKTSKRFVSRRD